MEKKTQKMVETISHVSLSALEKTVPLWEIQARPPEGGNGISERGALNTEENLRDHLMSIRVPTSLETKMSHKLGFPGCPPSVVIGWLR